MQLQWRPFKELIILALKERIIFKPFYYTFVKWNLPRCQSLQIFLYFSQNLFFLNNINRPNKMSGKNQKVKWTEEEDEAICAFISRHGPSKWTKMAQYLHQTLKDMKKSGKQCRQRWLNHLNPSIVREKWSIEEEKILFEEQKINGNKWSFIAEKLPGRSDNAIKNHFYSLIRKNIRRITKIVGGKDGTMKVKKLKPIVLSRIFQLTVEENSTIKSSNSKAVNRSEIADYLINFSKENLKERKISISNQQIENLRILLKKIEQMNKQIILHHDGYKPDSDLSDESLDSLSIEIEGQQLINNTKKHKLCQEPSNFEKSRKGRKIKGQLRKFSPKQDELYIAQIQQKMLEGVDGKKQNEEVMFLQEQDKKEGEERESEDKFNFCLDFSDQIVDDIDFTMQQNMNRTPYMITPNRKNKKSISSGELRSS